jgi:multisubunit Na+/H+ antiporter MnhB subunit
MLLLIKSNKQTMDFFNLKSPNFLGGNNVHNVIKIALAGFIVYKLVKK